MIRIERRDRVAIMSFDRGVTNALNLQLVDALAKTLQQVKQDAAVQGLVLTSSNEKFLSIGFDIPHLFELTKEDFGLFYRTFNQTCLDLYTLPKPTVVAITGHAIAGGCILALCCDYRFVAEGRKLMGLNEIKLGVPVPYPGDRILRDIVGVRYARDVMESGDFYPSGQLAEMGMVDRVLPTDQILTRSIEKAEALAAMSQEAFAMIKQNRIEIVEAQILARLKEKEQFFIECWYSVQVRERLMKAMEKF